MRKAFSRMLVCVFLVALLGHGAGALAQGAPITVPYLTTDAPADLTSLDIYPLESTGAAVVIYVHGGGWQIGDKAHVANLPGHLNGAGYVFVSVNYRLSPAVEFPVHAEDVAAAIAWVQGHIEDYGGDPARLFLIGHSAGAHLVALVATDTRYLGVHGLSPADLLGVIPLDTQAYDLAAMAAAMGGELPALTYAPVFGDDPAFWAFASPITYVAEGADLPAFLIPYNRRGTRSRATINEAFAAALRDSGGSAETLPVARAHNQFVRDFGATGDPVAPAVLAFLADLLSR